MVEIEKARLKAICVDVCMCVCVYEGFPYYLQFVFSRAQMIFLFNIHLFLRSTRMLVHCK